MKRPKRKRPFPEAFFGYLPGVVECGKPRKETAVKKPKLVLLLARLDTALVGRVVHQDKALRGKGVLVKVGRWTLKSSLWPELHDRCVYVRGMAKCRDRHMFTDTFADDQAAIDAARSIARLVAKFNGSKPVKSDWLSGVFVTVQ